PERFFIAEIVREQIFKQFRDEVPYSAQVNVTVYEERAGQKDFCDCEIVVERDAQKGILIGKRGAALKRLGAAARREIEAFTGRALYLQLHVKTRADWRNRDGFLRSYGSGS
ncbi:MAG: KH domain-containing protein, partial [Bacteroidota bacterium]